MAETLAKCYISTRYTCKALFPEKFSANFTTLHDQMFELLDNPDYDKVMMLAPRGIGKTSLAHAYIMRHILFRQKRFIMYVSNSLTVAEMQTENIKVCLQSTSLVKQMFGDLTISDLSGTADDSFSKKAWVAYGHTLILPRGSNQQVRGLLYHDHRPDLIVIDDLEDMETITNELQRLKRKDWFFGDLMKTPSRLKKDCKIVYIDTLKHEDALPTYLDELDEWKSITLSICDKDFHSYAPEFMTDDELKQEIDTYRAAGALDVFYREHTNIPVGPETQSFKPENFQHYKEHEDGMKEKLDALDNVVLVDPAKSLTPQSADSAAVGIALDMREGRIYIRDILSGKFYPDDFHQGIIDMAIRIKASVIGVEVAGLNEYIKQPMKNALTESGTFRFELVWLTPRKSKEDRIKSLISYYRRGSVFHNSFCCGPLEVQLLGFPRSKLWDIMDATAYVVQLMEEGGMYFYNSENESGEGIESEYDDLENEPALDGRELM